MRANRDLYTEIVDRNHPNDTMLSVTIAHGVIPQSALLEDSSKKDQSNLDRTAYKRIQPGDLAYNKMRAWQGAIGVSDLAGIISPAYVVQRPRRGQCPRYLHYLYRIPAFASEAERWSYGVTSDQWSLRPEHFKMIYSPLPPLEEQQAIAAHLDAVDAQTRDSISKLQSAIALAEEYRQAVISETVTGRCRVGGR